MPYVAFDAIEDAESYEFGGPFDYHEHCKKDLCWVEDDVWTFLSNFDAWYDLNPDVQIEDNYFIESVKIYIKLRIKNSKIVDLNVSTINAVDGSKDYFADSIKKYISNTTIDFMMELIEHGLDRPFPVNNEKDREWYTTAMNNLMDDAQFLNLTGSEYIKAITISKEADGSIFDMYNRLSFLLNVKCENRMDYWFGENEKNTVLERIEFTVEGGKKYSVKSALDFNFAPDIEQEMSRIKDYLNNIVIEVGDMINNKRKKLKKKLSKKTTKHNKIKKKLLNTSLSQQERIDLINKLCELSEIIQDLPHQITHENDIEQFVATKLDTFYEAFNILRKPPNNPIKKTEKLLNETIDEFGFKAKLAQLNKESNELY